MKTQKEVRHHEDPDSYRDDEAINIIFLIICASRLFPLLAEVAAGHRLLVPRWRGCPLQRTGVESPFQKKNQKPLS
jgi:hypothetical protein